MGLSDPFENVCVTLCLDDWAVIIAALSNPLVPVPARHRINAEIFRSAELTERALS